MRDFIRKFKYGMFVARHEKHGQAKAIYGVCKCHQAFSPVGIMCICGDTFYLVDVI